MGEEKNKEKKNSLRLSHEEREPGNEVYFAFSSLHSMCLAWINRQSAPMRRLGERTVDRCPLCLQELNSEKFNFSSLITEKKMHGLPTLPVNVSQKEGNTDLVILVVIYQSCLALLSIGDHHFHNEIIQSSYTITLFLK